MKVLFINGCMRGEASRTLELSKDYIDKFIKKKADEGEAWQVEEVDLNLMEIQPLDKELLAKRDTLSQNGNWEDKMFILAKQLMAADHIVMGVPYWDLSFPAKLKVYLEQCCVTGLTFIYNEKGIPEGQCKADTLTYITTSGGFIGPYNFGYDYIKGLCMLLGIGDTRFVSAEGLDIVGIDTKAVIDESKKSITEIVNMI